MPPKAKFSKEDVINSAFELTRRCGIEALSARSIARELSSSTAPLFSLFENVEEIRDCVIRKAFDLYSEYIKKGLEHSPSFKGTGLMYIRFAKEEPKLFRLLFMGEKRGDPTHFFPSGDSNAPEILKVIEKSYSLDQRSARKLYNHLSVYAHGIAVLFASGNDTFTLDDASEMLTEVFISLIHGGNI